MKVCCVLLFVIVHAVSGCIPGAVWMVDCNMCTCTPQGQSRCTYKACPKKCEPGTRWQEDCNGCYCSPEGQAICTLAECGRDKCKPGTRWQKDCNGCYCSPEGLAICTQKFCRGDMKIKNNQEKCKPGTRWMDDCNGCYCSPDGRAICTQAGCRGDMKIKNNQESTESSQSPSNSKRECEPGSILQMDCNTCICSSEGRWSECTMMGCPDKCEPGSSWMKDCNRCYCTPHGREACTRMRCPKNRKSSQRSLMAHRGASTSWRSFPEHENEESSEKLNLEERNQTSPGTAVITTEQPTTSQITPGAGTTEPTRCEPGSAWAIDCKFCICTAAGMEICKFECGGPEESKRVNEQKGNALRRRSHLSFFHDSKPFSKLGRRRPHSPLKVPNGSRQMREWGKPALMSSGGNA